jgi:hypothetical protein
MIGPMKKQPGGAFRPSKRGSLRLAALVAATAMAAAAAHATPGPPAAVTLSTDASVRRFEWVLVVRISMELPDSIARAEVVAGRAGGAVLENIRTDTDGTSQYPDRFQKSGYADYRLLVRTIDRETINGVLRQVRATRGVVGASATALPETPTWEGSPGFMESYTADSDAPQISNAGRVLTRHDVPPVADKRELLEAADVIAAPGIPPLDDLRSGGLTFNFSELLKRLKESSWRKREERLRNTPIVILPPDGGDTQTISAP